MFAIEMISTLVRSVKLSDNCNDVLDWMYEDHVNHLPVIEDGRYLGLISDTSILDLFDSNLSIDDSRIPLVPNFVPGNLHIYEIIRMICNSTLTVVPVVDDKEKFLGVITIHDVYEQFSKLSAITEPGGVIVLELNVKDYSLAHIARLVESCNSIILSSYAVLHADSTKMDLTLKINNVDLSEIISTFERFSFTIKLSLHESVLQENLEDRYAELMHYINM